MRKHSKWFLPVLYVIQQKQETLAGNEDIILSRLQTREDDVFRLEVLFFKKPQQNLILKRRKILIKVSYPLNQLLAIVGESG